MMGILAILQTTYTPIAKLVWLFSPTVTYPGQSLVMSKRRLLPDQVAASGAQSASNNQKLQWHFSEKLFAPTVYVVQFTNQSHE